MGQKVKTVLTNYLIKVNNEVAWHGQSLRDARKAVSTLVLNEEVHTVVIVKQTVNETILNKYHPKTTKVLVAGELDFDITD